jgi:HAE1 family hydrophobic/amphiphilic exporter-1
MFTLGGLALGVGRLVDDAIVVLENIYRHRSAGESPEQAAIQGSGEVGMAVLASTITTIVVFLPVVFITGIAKLLFTPLALRYFPGSTFTRKLKMSSPPPPPRSSL